MNDDVHICDGCGKTAKKTDEQLPLGWSLLMERRDGANRHRKYCPESRPVCQDD